MTRPAPHCCKCNAAIFSEAEKISKADRGGRAAYICADCLEATSETNEATRGTETASGYEYISYLYIDAQAPAITAELITYNWTRGNGRTSSEAVYISPKLQSLKPLPKKAATVERIAAEQGRAWNYATLEVYPAYLSDTADRLAHRAAYAAEEAGEYLTATVESAEGNRAIEFVIDRPTAAMFQALTRYAKKTTAAIMREAEAVEQGKRTLDKATARTEKAIRKAYEAEPYLLIY